MPETAAARLRGCFTTLFPSIPEAQIELATVDTVEEWDSIATVNLVSLIEEEFGISVDFDDTEKLTSFSKLLDYVRTAGA